MSADLSLQTGPSGLRDRAAVFAVHLADRVGLLDRPLGVGSYVRAYDLYKSWTDRGPVAFLSRLVRPGDVVVDVGANVGFYTTRMARLVGARGRVIAYEPSGWAVGALRRRVGEQRLRNVEIRPFAVSDAPGDVSLFPGLFPSDSRVYQHPGADLPTRVPAVRLDIDLADEPAIRLLKIDVQGAEVQVARGLVGLLDRGAVSCVLLEYWPAGMRANGTDPLELLRILEGASLRPAWVSAGGRLISSSWSEVARVPANRYPDVAFVHDAAA